MIYFIQVGKSGPVKIGYSSAPRARLASLQTGSPFGLVMLAVIDGDQEKERSLHCSLEASRIRGEWFYPSHDVLAALAEHQKASTAGSSSLPEKSKPTGPGFSLRLETQQREPRASSAEFYRWAGDTIADALRCFPRGQPRTDRIRSKDQPPWRAIVAASAKARAARR